MAIYAQGAPGNLSHGEGMSVLPSLPEDTLTSALTHNEPNVGQQDAMTSSDNSSSLHDRIEGPGTTSMAQIAVHPDGLVVVYSHSFSVLSSQHRVKFLADFVSARFLSFL